MARQPSNERKPEQAPAGRPWFRSLTFWFGLLPLVFILWSWRDSGRAMAMATISSSHGYLMAGQTQGALMIVTSNGFRPLDSHNKFRVHREPGASFKQRRQLAKHGGWHFPRAFESFAVGETLSRARFTFVAWWFVAAVHLVLWAALLWWRWRRKRRSPLLPAD